ncbi:hypothetical protein [Roseibium sediminicola]|uniref:Uncharacterized protein n=1 Tax=Roseibium sediminicola TaxID=2933272 RepID=A0ABT0H540_9HYPH|nr:hypothetical protein [Roseibium sp. CAU 1639]MCK7616180.1 hypothetical protein [Roseibium sp. CAU 1639]
MISENRLSKSSYRKPKLRYRSQFPTRIDWDNKFPHFVRPDLEKRPTRRPQARKMQQEFLKDKQHYIESLKAFLAEYGIDLQPTEDALQKVGEFFLENADADEESENIHAEWWMFLLLVMLYLGEVAFLLDKSGTLKWDVVNIAPKGMTPNFSYVLDWGDPDMDWGIENQLLDYAYGVISSKSKNPNLFSLLVKEALFLANRTDLPQKYDDMGLDACLELTFDDFRKLKADVGDVA